MLVVVIIKICFQTVIEMLWVDLELRPFDRVASDTDTNMRHIRRIIIIIIIKTAMDWTGHVLVGSKQEQLKSSVPLFVYCFVGLFALLRL